MGVFRDAIRQLIQDRQAQKNNAKTNLGVSEPKTRSQYIKDYELGTSPLDSSMRSLGFDAGFAKKMQTAQDLWPQVEGYQETGPREWGSRWLAKDDARREQEEKTQAEIDALTEAYNAQPQDFKDQYTLNEFIQQAKKTGQQSTKNAVDQAKEDYDTTHEVSSNQETVKLPGYTIDENGNVVFDEVTDGGGDNSKEPPSSEDTSDTEDDVPWYEQDPDIDVDSWYYAWRQWMIDNGLADRYDGLLDFQQNGTYDEWNQLVHDDDFLDYYQPFLDEYGDFQGYWDHFKKLAVWNALNGDWTMAQELWGSDWDTLRAVVDEAYRGGIDFYPEFEEDALQALAEAYGGEYADTKALAAAAREDPELAAALAPITATWAQAGTYNPDMDTSEYGNEISAKELKRIQRQNKNRY